MSCVFTPLRQNSQCMPYPRKSGLWLLKRWDGLLWLQRTDAYNCILQNCTMAMWIINVVNLFIYVHIPYKKSYVVDKYRAFSKLWSIFAYLGLQLAFCFCLRYDSICQWTLEKSCCNCQATVHLSHQRGSPASLEAVHSGFIYNFLAFPHPSWRYVEKVSLYILENDWYFCKRSFEIRIAGTTQKKWVTKRLWE